MNRCFILKHVLEQVVQTGMDSYTKLNRNYGITIFVEGLVFEKVIFENSLCAKYTTKFQIEFSRKQSCKQNIVILYLRFTFS